MGGTLALLLGAGGLIGALDHKRFAARWLLAAALLVAVNDAALTRVYHLVPNLLPGEMNWQGKALALLATLAVVALPAFGRRRVGLTLAQEPGSLRASIPVAPLYGAVFVGFALAFPSEPTREDVAFQLTMPGLEEEPFYRAILLFALDRAFTGRVRLLGVD